MKSYLKNNNKKNKNDLSATEEKRNDEYIAKSDEEKKIESEERENEKTRKLIEKGNIRLERMKIAEREKSNIVWKASVPIKIGWNENKNSIHTIDDLIVILKQFYNNDYKDAKRDLEQINKQAFIDIVNEKPLNKEKYFSAIAMEIREKLK